MGKNLLIINCILAIFFAAGCDLGGLGVKAQYKRQVNLTVPAGQAENFAAETHNGDITIKGSETTDCNLTATITVRADTEENAKTIAEQVKIDMVFEANDIKVKIEKPENLKYVQISIDLDAILPVGMNLSLKSHNGDISTNGIAGCVEAFSHNGDITTVGASAGLKAETHNGDISATGTLTNIELKTHNGDLTAICDKQFSNPCVINLESHNGDIEFASPENFSAAVDGSTNNGSIHTTLPLTISGEKHNKVNGVIGDGRDKLQVKTYNGSINIK